MIHSFYFSIGLFLQREAAKKIFLRAPGGGGKGMATKKKELFLSSKKNPTKKIPSKNVAIKLEGGGVRP